MVDIRHVRHNDLGFLAVVDKPPNGSATQGLGIDAINLLPSGGAPERVEPIYHDEPGLSCDHFELLCGVGASRVFRLPTRSWILPKAPSRCSARHVARSDFSPRAKPSLSSFQSVLCNVWPYQFLPSDRILQIYGFGVNRDVVESTHEDKRTRHAFARTGQLFRLHAPLAGRPAQRDQAEDGAVQKATQTDKTAGQALRLSDFFPLPSRFNSFSVLLPRIVFNLSSQLLVGQALVGQALADDLRHRQPEAVSIVQVFAVVIAECLFVEVTK